MAIVKSPLPITVPSDRPGRLTDLLSIGTLLRDVTIALAGIFKVIEWHEDEFIESSGTLIPHKLGRVPRGVVVYSTDSNRVVYQNRNQWTREVVHLQTGAGTATVNFILFLLLACFSLPVGAAECAQYGYTQGDVVRLWLCAAATDTTTGAAEGDYRYNKDTNAVLSYDGATWNAVGGGGGAPTTAQYWVGAADATLSAEHNLGALSTGLVINTTGTPSAFTGTNCTNQFPRSLSASGAATCASVASADFGANILATANGGTGLDTSATADDRVLVSSGAGWVARGMPDCVDSGGNHLNYTAATNLFSCGTSGSGGSTPTGTGYRHVTGGVEDAAADLVTLTSATEVAPNQGTTTTVLHGNAAGQASFAAVDLTNDTSSVLPLAKLTDDASSGLCLLSGGGGDPAWTTCPGGGGGLSYAQVAAAALAGF